MPRSSRKYWLVAVAVATLQIACDTSEPMGPDRPDGWTEATHGKGAPANYEVVFAQDRVKRLDITIDPRDWDAMMADMTKLVGEFGAGGSGPDIPPEAIAACAGLAAGNGCTIAIMGMTIDGTCTPVFEDLVCVPPGGGPPADSGGPSLDLVGDPIWVQCTVEAEAKKWLHVGLRFKGNSTLAMGWSRGSYKLPLKLDFDQFEDEYPEISDQRFHGFKKLALANNELDPSYLRDKVAGDLFRESGVPAPRRAFYRVFIDAGDGPTYFGLYTMAEVPAKPMFLSQFGESGGNLYKPEGGAASWVAGLPIGEESFAKKSNKDEADWSDVVSAITALNASRADTERWKRNLEQLFDVDGFLRWLAMNTVMQDWDTYGNIAHNYYLYSHPGDGGRLHWIPWDHNMSLGSPLGLLPPLALDMQSVGEEWPLIRFLLDDPTYAATYWAYVATFDDDLFSEASMTSRLTREHALIAPYVIGVEGEQPGHSSGDPGAFEASVDELMTHVTTRHAAVIAAINEVR